MNQQLFLPNEFSELKAELQSHKPSEVFVVRTKRSFETSGGRQLIESLFNNDYDSFYDFEPNPKIEDLQKGIEKIEKKRYTLIVAIGGGTAIDIAKVLKAVAYQHYHLEDVVKGAIHLNDAGLPMVAIPTTAGTGSEATQFSVMYIGKQKYSISSSHLLPEYVYLEPKFTQSAKPYLSACTGLDALCQAVEALWCVHATDESCQYSIEAIALVKEHLANAVHRNTIESRLGMQRAAFLAGQAINITRTTAPHAISYAFTSHYGIPHGHAVALSLPFFSVFNYMLDESNCTDTRGASAVQGRIELYYSIFDAKVDTISAALRTFFNEVNIDIHLSTLIPDLEPSLIVRNVNTQRLGNNPRTVESHNIQQFIDETNQA